MSEISRINTDETVMKSYETWDRVFSQDSTMRNSRLSSTTQGY